MFCPSQTIDCPPCSVKTSCRDRFLLLVLPNYYSYGWNPDADLSVKKMFHLQPTPHVVSVWCFCISPRTLYWTWLPVIDLVASQVFLMSTNSSSTDLHYLFLAYPFTFSLMGSSPSEVSDSDFECRKNTRDEKIYLYCNISATGFNYMQ